MATSCTHLDQARPVQPNTKGCEECLKSGQRWVALRMCLVCGHVGCCDSSPGRHATGHFKQTGHPVMKSVEPGQDWSWCYIDKAYL
ncbi:MAG TPA: UBP-type zinc finger domain-containing protein [Terriglobia bacterium]|nr:UBP-type zinc finger domain-containing protein [Terriglobia bacterium]